MGKQAGAGGEQAIQRSSRKDVKADPMVGKSTQFKPGKSGNPKGTAKGTVHLSTHIKNMLNDPKFETLITHPTKGYVPYKGAPVKAIISTALIKAVAGDDKAREWLAKYGYGTKVELANPDGTGLFATTALTIKVVHDRDYPQP